MIIESNKWKIPSDRTPVPRREFCRCAVQKKQSLVLSYNIWFVELKVQARMQAVGDIILNTDPSVILFQVMQCDDRRPNEPNLHNSDAPLAALLRGDVQLQSDRQL
eukprot:205022-Pyramimonas_sp.AAC.1